MIEQQGDQCVRDILRTICGASEEECSCSYSGFYQRGMGVCEEPQGSLWSGRNGRWSIGDTTGALGNGNETTGDTIEEGAV